MGDRFQRRTGDWLGGESAENNNTVVNNVTYNAANQLLTFNTETRTYNNLNQMTQLTITGTQPLNISYNFTAGANNGKITSQTDNLSGETVTYQYDSLNRLLSASSSQSWSETYGFDAFGNLLSKTPTGGAPTLSQSVYTTSNQIMEQTYDSNGNQISSPLGSLSYDAENRVVTGPGGVQYAYDSRNKRVWRGTLSNGVLAQQVYVYGVDGQKIGTYTFTLGQYGETNTPEMVDWSNPVLAVFFGSKRIGTYDRLGSAKYNQNNAAQSFYPYGEDRGTMQPNDSLKFATYTRDTATGLDYADQRYYANNFGRFMSPDPGNAGGLSNPQSLNRYSYVLNDPINGSDPRGLCPVFLAGINTSPPGSQDLQTFAGATGDITAFPYAGGGIPSDVADIIVQGAAIPTGATLTALEAIALAAQSPGPINIFAYSGGAATLQSAWRLLTSAIQARITSITYIDPGSFGTTLPVAANTTVFGDTSTLTNSFLINWSNRWWPGEKINVVKTGACGHSLDCVLENFFDQLVDLAGDPCQVGAYSVFGAVGRRVPALIGGDPFTYLYFYEYPLTPSVTSTISYSLESVTSTISYSQ